MAPTKSWGVGGARFIAGRSAERVVASAHIAIGMVGVEISHGHRADIPVEIPIDEVGTEKRILEPEGDGVVAAELEVEGRPERIALRVFWSLTKLVRSE